MGKDVMKRDLSGRKYTVYKHTTPDGRSYIGMTSQPLEVRYGSGHGYDRSPRFRTAIKLFGWANIDHTVIGTDLSQDEAAKLERDLIRALDTTNPEHGYNISTGGLCGTTGVKFGPDTIQRMSEARRGPKNPRYGIKISREESKKLSDLRKGHFSEKQRQNLELARRKHMVSVVCIDTGIVFESIKAAADFAGITSRGIWSVCNGQQFTAGGYRWKYFDGGDRTCL